MILTVDPDLATPVWEQLRLQLVAMAQSGVLAPGAQLPPIRQLADDLGLAAGTVAKVYKALEADGVIVTRGRRGTCIADGQVQTIDRSVLDAARDYLAVARRHGMDLKAAASALERAADDPLPT